MIYFQYRIKVVLKFANFFAQILQNFVSISLNFFCLLHGTSLYKIKHFKLSPENLQKTFQFFFQNFREMCTKFSLKFLKIMKKFLNWLKISSVNLLEFLVDKSSTSHLETSSCLYPTQEHVN